MKKVLIVVTLLSFATSLVSFAANEKKLPELADAELLNQKDLLEFFSEKRVAQSTSPSGKYATVYFFPDGTLRIAGKKGMDEGKYKIENGQFCSKWKKIRKGKEMCFKIYRSEGNKFTWIKPDGSTGPTRVFKEIF